MWVDLNAKDGEVFSTVMKILVYALGWHCQNYSLCYISLKFYLAHADDYSMQYF